MNRDEGVTRVHSELGAGCSGEEQAYKSGVAYFFGYRILDRVIQ